MLLVDFARDEIGLQMGSRIGGLHIGWTTDQAKAEAFVTGGGRMTTITAQSGRLIGYEVSCLVGTEWLGAAA